MMSFNLTYLFILAIAISAASAFTPSKHPTNTKKPWTSSAQYYVPMKRVGAAAPPAAAIVYRRNACSAGSVCKMSSDAETEAAKLREQAQKLREEAAEAAGVSVEELTNSDGTVYDDDPMLVAPRDNLSSSMKERLMREASTGLDSNEKQTNVILYISVAVAVLVLLGGQGILF